MKYSPLVLATILLISKPLFASQEGAESFEAFDIKTPAATIHGTQKQGGITDLRIDAFGKTFTLSQEQLKKLKGLMVNGVQVSSEPGHTELGAMTIYIKLSLGFVSEEISSKYIVVSERDGIDVRDLP